MPALTPTFLFDFESNMQAITENEYARMAASLWWTQTTKVRPSAKKREIIAWLLSTATIKDQGKGGNLSFEDLVALSTTYVNGNSGDGLKMTRDQIEDLDGSGLDIGTKWSADIGAYMAYWPQKQTSIAILNGETGVGYDSKAFFATDHPVNPLASNSATYANLFTGAASGAYPGALPIDDSVTVEVALTNLSKAIAYIKSIKMPNGVDPRFLKPNKIMVPPRMVPRAQQLTNAKFIAQAVSGGGGSGDITSIVANWGFQQPIEVQEFSANASYTVDATGATVTGSDDTWYLVCEEVSSTQLGALVYVDRESFKITYYTGQGGGTGVDAILDRARELEWHCQGRNVTGYGHPYLLHKFKKT